MTISWVCVDASLVVKLVVQEPFSDKSRLLWRTWQKQGWHPAAPSLLHYEVTSVLRKHVTRRFRTVQESRQALQQALAFDIQHPEPPDLHQRAFDLADQLGRPTAYDAHYLALAAYLNCEFWTADERLVNAVQVDLPWVKWLGEPDR